MGDGELTDSEKLGKIHDFCIRMEPVIEDVKALKKWRDGNGVPGARFQLWILWMSFLAVVGKIWGGK
jgi:hypothetical protein